jgi:filamentous hemagglutinin family protein
MITSLLKKTIKPAIHFLVLLSYLVSFVLPVNLAYAHTDDVSGAAIPAPPAPIVKDQPAPLPIGLTPAEMQDFGHVKADNSHGHGPLIDKAPNGVLLELIRKPDGAGISYNQLKEMDVGARGLILNNSTEKNARSRLGGEIIGNHLLQGQNARIIIQEVTGKNTSQIRGFIEVHGKAAELIIVNPNGIDVNGAGFINIPRATLSTGQLQDLSNGRPIQLKIDGGEITIQGKGLSLKGVSQFDIVTRKVNFDGKLYGAEDNTDASVRAGKQIYDYEGRTSQVHDDPSAEAAPVYAIDSSALGGMYAGKIALISTEKGVGVRAPEDMASRMSDITILANGDVVLKNASSDNGKIEVKSKNGSVTVEKDKKVHGTEGVKLAAQKKIEIAEGATVKAGTTVELSARTVSNQGEILAGQKISGHITRGLENHGSMVSQSALDVSAKSITNHGKIKAGQKLLLKGFDQLENKRHANIESNGMLLLNGQNLENHGAMLSQSLMDIRLSDNMLNDGWIRSHHGLKIFLNGHFLNTYQGDHIGGEMLITGPLLIRGKDDLKARHIENRSAIIETLGLDGNMSFKAKLVQNKMAKQEYVTSTDPVHHPFKRNYGTIEYSRGSSRKGRQVDTKDRLISKDNPAQLFASGNIDIEADKTVNEMSFITAAKSITLNGDELIAKGRILREERASQIRRRGHSEWSPDIDRPSTDVKIIDSQSLASWIHAGEDITYNLKTEFKQESELDQNVKDNVAYVASNRNESPEMVINSEDFAFQASESPFLTINKGAGAHYLIETRKKYVNAGSMMGSDYFLSRMGLGNAKRYGDAFVERHFLRKQIFENGLADRLGAAHSEAELIRQLYDNAIEEAKDLELYPGIKMTAELISQLKRDMIWMEKEIVGGEEVLVPRLYVARSTRMAQLINNGISAKNIDIKAGTVIAQGAILSQGKTHIEAEKSALFVGANVDGKETKVTAGETVFNLSSALAGDSLAVKGQNIYSETVTRTIEGPHSSITTAQGQASFTSRAAPLTLESEKEGSQQYYGTNLHGEQGIQFKSGGAPVYLGSVETGSHLAMNSRKHKRNEQHTHHVKSSVTTGAGYDVIYETGDLTFQGVDHHAGGNIVAKVDGTFENTPVHDYDYVQKSSKSKGSFGRKKSKDSTHMSDQVNRNVLTADGGTVSIISKEDNHNVAPEIHAHVGAELRSTEGKVILKSDTSTEQHVKNKSSSNVAWQKTAGNGKVDETVEEPIMDTSNLVTEGALGTELSLKARGNLEQTLAALSADPNMAWAAELAKDPAVQIHLVKEYHKHWDYKQSGLTPGGAAIIALAVAIATAGAGSAISAGVAGAAGSAGASAGTAAWAGAASKAAFMSLVSAASVSLANNKGDVHLVLKELSSKQQMRSLAVAILTANTAPSGPLDQITVGTVLDKAQSIVVDSAYKAGVQTAIMGGKFGDHFKQTVQTAGVNAIADQVIHEVGQLKHESDKAIEVEKIHPNLKDLTTDTIKINSAVHMAMHAGTGALTAAALKKDPAIGAFAAMIGELVAEQHLNSADPRTMTEAERDQYAQAAVDYGKMAGALTAFFITEGREDISYAADIAERSAKYNTIADQKLVEYRNKLKEAAGKKLVEAGYMTQAHLDEHYADLSLGDMADIYTKQKTVFRLETVSDVENLTGDLKKKVIAELERIAGAKLAYEAGDDSLGTSARYAAGKSLEWLVKEAKAVAQASQEIHARTNDVLIDPNAGLSRQDWERLKRQDRFDYMNDFGSVLLGNYEESAEYRNLALGSGAVKVSKDAASVGWSALKWTGRSTGEVIGAFLGMGSDRAIANGRAAGDFIPDVVLLIGTGGLSSAGRATVQGGVAVANGIEKAAVFTKNMVQAAGTMTRGGELAYAGAGVGSSTSKVGAAVRGAEMGNLAREGVSGAREAAAGISEKSVARDIDLRVKNVESGASSRIGFRGRDYVRDMETRSGLPINSEQRGLLKEALQEKDFKKLSPEEKKLHSAPFKNEKFKDGLKSGWEKNTGQKWPGEMRFNPKTNKVEHYPDQLHHIIPQEVGGLHEWWNIHPLRAGSAHQGGVHGKNSPLRQIMKEIK